MKIKLTKLFTGEFYFEIINNDDVYSTSKEISKAFNLDVDVYNSILANKVIQHKQYNYIYIYEDLVFYLNNISMKTYINRFKNTFIKELTLLALGNG